MTQQADERQEAPPPPSTPLEPPEGDRLTDGTAERPEDDTAPMQPLDVVDDRPQPGDVGPAGQPLGTAHPPARLQDETASSTVFSCPAPTHTDPAERCAGRQFERAPVIALMTDGRELAAAYLCSLCGATYTFNPAAGEFDQVWKPRWQR